MEELHEAAMAYYNNCSRDIQVLAWNFFRAMDIDGDGRVSLAEFVEFLRLHGYHWVRPSFFHELDRDRDGSLDFWEVLTLYYTVKTRNVHCDQCRVFLHGLYFTCLVCFDNGNSNTYDLCSSCYQRRIFRHPHTHFIDSYVLLRSRRISRSRSTNMNMQNIPQPNAVIPVEPARGSWGDAFHALEVALAMGNLALLSGCCIM